MGIVYFFVVISQFKGEMNLFRQKIQSVQNTHHWRGWHIDGHSLVGFFVSGCSSFGVNEQDDQDGDSLNGTVEGTQHEDNVGVFPIELAGCKHDGEHDEHFVESHFSS